MQPSLSRRNILAAAALGAIAGGRPASATAGTRVVVIGAGMAGLSAARTLADAGCSVTVMEARERLGGRIATFRGLGAPVELGASWIHGAIDNPVAALARRASLRTFATDAEEKIRVYRPGGRAVADRELDAAEARYARLLARIDDDLEEGDDTSLAAAIGARDPAFLTDAVHAWVMTDQTESDIAAPADAISAYWFDEDSVFKGADVVCPAGYDQILPQLARGLDIRLRTEVRRIARSPAGLLTVETAQARTEAEYVVCTVPLGVLKAESITFDPPLPEAHRDAIARIGVGASTRLSLEFADPFWPTDLHVLGHVSAARGRWPIFVNARVYAGKNILTAVATGPYAAKGASMSADDLVRDALDALGDMLGRKTPPPTGSVVSDWSGDPYARGAYSVVSPGAAPRHFNVLSEPVESRLFLCGEHTDFAWHGTVHGAHLAGLRAAKAIITRAGR